MRAWPSTACRVRIFFERFMPLVAAKAVKAVMNEKVTPKRRLWLLHSASMEALPEEYRSTARHAVSFGELEPWAGVATLSPQPVRMVALSLRCYITSYYYG